MREHRQIRVSGRWMEFEQIIAHVKQLRFSLKQEANACTIEVVALKPGGGLPYKSEGYDSRTF